MGMGMGTGTGTGVRRGIRKKDQMTSHLMITSNVLRKSLCMEESKRRTHGQKAARDLR